VGIIENYHTECICNKITNIRKKEESNPKLVKTECELYKKISYTNPACVNGSSKAKLDVTYTKDAWKIDQLVGAMDMQIQFKSHVW